MTYTLKHYDYWPSSQAARIALLENGTTATISSVDMTQSPFPPLPSDTGDGNPPLLIDSSHTHAGKSMQLWDALAMAKYLQCLNPTDPCYCSIAFEWAVWGRSQLATPLEVYLLNNRLLPSAQRDTGLESAGKALVQKALARLESFVPDVSGGNKFLATVPGDATGVFSIADVVVGAATQLIHIVYAALMPQATYPKTYAYTAMLAQRSSWSTAFQNVTP